MDCRIYLLSDPRTHEPMYVGVTWDSLNEVLQRRMAKTSGGRLGLWLSDLQRQDLSPEIVELERPHDCDWRAAEEKWIQHYRDQGADLFNVTLRPRDVLLSETHRKRISEGLKQKYREDPEYRKKVSRAVSQYHQLMNRRRLDRLRAAKAASAAKED